jgi:hypothetical protein
VDGAGQRYREESRRRAGNHRDGLTGMAEDELRLGVVLALLRKARRFQRFSAFQRSDFRHHRIIFRQAHVASKQTVQKSSAGSGIRVNFPFAIRGRLF